MHLEWINLIYLIFTLSYIIYLHFPLIDFVFNLFLLCFTLNAAMATTSAGKDYAVTSVALVAALFLAAAVPLIQTRIIASYLHQTSWFTYSITRQATV